MSTVSFVEKLKGLKITQFEFVDFVKNVSSPSEEKPDERFIYLTFDLAVPIPSVIGSKGEYDPISKKRISDIATDVVKVNCSLDLIEKYASEFVFHENGDDLTKAGEYKGDMFLDISSQGSVWLTDTKFSKMSQDWKQNKRSERLQRLVAAHEGLKKTA
jgi:hypothetical protein